jgi:chemotaxis protein histidine kinase CheA
MSEKRRKLRARFRESAVEQLAQLRPIITELGAGRGEADALRSIGRVLHTLKGDASLVGLQFVSDKLHIAEDLSEASSWSDLIEALAAISRDLQRMDDDGRIPTPEGAPAAAPAHAPAAASAPAAAAAAAPAAASTPAKPVMPPLPGPPGRPGTAAPAAVPAAHAAPAAHVAPAAHAAPAAAPATPASAASPAAPAGAPRPAPAGLGTATAMLSSTPTPSAGAPPIDPVARQRWIHLQTEVLDDLSERLLELSTMYGRLAARLVQAAREAPTETLRIAVDDADAARRMLDDVVGAAWALRLVSVEDLLRRLGTHASEIAESQGKRMRVIVDGGRAELERSTIDALEQPLIHLIRNAVDHGIEEPDDRGAKPVEATLALIARTVGGTVEISVEDDGRGIDPDRVRFVAVERGMMRPDEAEALSEQAVFDLLFMFGFSTKRQATALSGRGVGLDAVRGKVEALGGEVRLASRPGNGTRFVLSVPAAIARERAVVVECTGGGVFALPSRAIVSLIRLSDYRRGEVAGGLAIEHGGNWAPLRALDDVLGLSGLSTGVGDRATGLVIDAQERRYVFAVERVIGEHDLLRRPADQLVGQGGVVTASSVLDDGRVALWPAIPALLRGLRGRASPRLAPAQERQRQRVLVVEDSPIVRELVTSILRTADFDATPVGDGAEALQALAGGTPDLIISDVEMPRVDGFELLRRVRERWPRLPMVMLTTRGSDEDRRRAATLGANAYLVKAEFEQSRLLDTVRRLIGGFA